MTIRILITGVILFFIQIGFWPGIFPETFAPEFQIPVIVALSLLIGRKEAILYAGISGLVMDLYFTQAMGVRLLIYVVLAYILGTYRHNFAKKSSFANGVMTLVASFSFQFFYALLLTFGGWGISLYRYITIVFSHELILQFALSYILYFIYIRGVKKKKHHFS
ncbi:MAG: rod shape-determining protein MreD [Tissierellia bacterium]|nr:rod shape-determining protein MreD [Tissierellia bacterium]